MICVTLPRGKIDEVGPVKRMDVLETIRIQVTTDIRRHRGEV